MPPATIETRSELQRFIGRHRTKEFDWGAFPRSKGFPELGRAQMRYIGAGGSPKVDDPNTLKPEHFSLSMINLPVGHYGVSHIHDDCEEIFLGIDGLFTVGWAWGDEVIEAFLGPKDLIMLPVGQAHGYRNDSTENVRFSVMVASATPHLPVYISHPTQSDRAKAFGAAVGKTEKLSPHSSDPRHRKMAENIVRYSERPVHWHDAGFGWIEYIGGSGGVPAGNFRANLIHVPRGKGVRLYGRDVEDAYYVLEGTVTVGWECDGRIVEERLGQWDVVFNPAGRLHHFRNDGLQDAQFMMAVGTAKAEDVPFKSA